MSVLTKILPKFSELTPCFGLSQYPAAHLRRPMEWSGRKILIDLKLYSHDYFITCIYINGPYQSRLHQSLYSTTSKLETWILETTIKVVDQKKSLCKSFFNSLFRGLPISDSDLILLLDFKIILNSCLRSSSIFYRLLLYSKSSGLKLSSFRCFKDWFLELKTGLSIYWIV